MARTSSPAAVEAGLPRGLAARLADLLPGARIVDARALADDADTDDATHAKALGYGKPVRIALDTAAGPQAVVFHTIRADDFGHDRRADRIANVVLARDTFAQLPHHVAALDAGVIAPDGTLATIPAAGEPYFLTRWQPGTIYAHDLRRIATTGDATPRDRARVDALVRALADIHAGPGSHPAAYARSLRDLLGHGEGIFGLVDAYAADTPAAPPDRLRRIEERCLAWRWQLRHRADRLRRIHGDFHPFNIAFDGDADEVVLLDASRGCEGDPADDVACLAINFVFFGIGPRRDPRGLATLWTRFWDGYLAAMGDDVLAAVAPFFAWRGLVLASPRWYPDLGAPDRDRILTFVERALASPRFDPAWGLEVLAS